MENCIVSKFNGVFNNDGALYFDAIHLKFSKGSNSNYMYVGSILNPPTPVHVKVVDSFGNTITDSDISSGGTFSVTPPSGSDVYDVFIKGKEFVANIARTTGVVCNLQDLNFAINTNPLLPYNIINGSLESLYHNIGMESMTFKGLLEASTLRGDVSGLFVALLQNGKTTDLSVSAKESHGYLTFLGNPIDNNISPNDYIYATFENGTTINVYKDSGKTQLYATYNKGEWSV